MQGGGTPSNILKLNGVGVAREASTSHVEGHFVHLDPFKLI